MATSRRIFSPLGTEHFAAAGGTIGGGDYPNAVLNGSTKNFEVFIDPSVGPDSGRIGKSILAVCERDFTTITAEFGLSSLPSLPIRVIVATGIGGAYHYGCNAVDLYCGVSSATPPDPWFTEFLMCAELVEVCEAVQNKGWDCGASNGEGLSRALATAIYPGQILVPGFATAGYWLDNGRPDWVNSTFTGSATSAGDGDPAANGCAVLFLNYLRYQLGHPWNVIARAGGNTLAETYRNVTGDVSDPFPAFTSILARRFPVGQTSGLQSDNPFPIT